MDYPSKDLITHVSQSTTSNGLPADMSNPMRRRETAVSATHVASCNIEKKISQ